MTIGNTDSGGKVAEMHDLVQKKCETYDKEAMEAKKEDESEFATTEQIGFCDMLWRNADCSDRIIWWCAASGSALFGCALPGFCLLFGDMIDSLGGVGQFDMLKEQAYWMTAVGLAAWLFSFLQVALFSIFAENVTFKTRVKYY